MKMTIYFKKKIFHFTFCIYVLFIAGCYLPGGIMGGTDYLEKIRNWRQKNKEVF